ncbi:hypothetical protein D3C87_1552290 [compost metagenome]
MNVETRNREDRLQLRFCGILISPNQIPSLYLGTGRIQFYFPLVIAAEILQIAVMRRPQDVIAICIRSTPAVDMADARYHDGTKQPRARQSAG